MLNKLTVREKIVVVVAFLSLMSGLFYFNLYQPLKWEELELKSDVEQKRFKYLQSLNLVKRRLPKVKAAKQEVVEDYQDLLEQFPKQKEISTFLLEIEGLAKTQGIKLDYFSPKSLERVGDFYQLPIDIAFFASYQQMVAFIYALEQSPKMIQIADFEVRKPSNGTVGELQVNLMVNSYIVDEEQVQIE